MPAYTDSTAAMALIGTDNPKYLDDTALWHRDLDALRTKKWTRFDAFAGTAILSVSMLLAIGFLGLRNARNMAKLRTVRSKALILVVIAAVWLALVPAWFYSVIIVSMTRNYVPWWADSAGIPLLGIVTTAALGFSVSLVVAAGLLARAKLPVSLWLWRRDRPTRSAIFSLGAILLLLILLAWLVAAILAGAHLDIPLIVLLIYLLATVRAAALSV